MSDGILEWIVHMNTLGSNLFFNNHQGIEGATNKKRSSLKQHNKMISSFNQFVQRKHNHAQEKARRIKQIERGILTIHNGLTT